MGEALTASRPLPEKWCKGYLVIVPWSYSLLNYSIVWNASITGLFDQILQTLLCNFSLLCKAYSVFFGALSRPHMTVSHTHRDSYLGDSSYYMPKFMLVFKPTKRFDSLWFYYPELWLYPDTSFVVPASKPFIHQMVGTTHVIEVFSVITDCGGPWLLRGKLPQDVLTVQVESTFSGEVMREQFCGGRLSIGEIEVCC